MQGTPQVGIEHSHRKEQKSDAAMQRWSDVTTAQKLTPLKRPARRQRCN
jgi:hypothetical protein